MREAGTMEGEGGTLHNFYTPRVSKTQTIQKAKVTKCFFLSVYHGRPGYLFYINISIIYQLCRIRISYIICI